MQKLKDTKRLSRKNKFEILGGQVYFLTLFEILIFCPKIQLWLPEKIVDFSGWKNRENVVVLDFLAVDNFDFTRKIDKKNGWKTREIVGVLDIFVKIEFWTKIWLFE